MRKFSLYCITEGSLVYTDFQYDPPAVCPNNPLHEIDLASVAIYDNEYVPSNATVLPRDPTVYDDVNVGYLQGFPWFNSVSGMLFMCVDNSLGNAKWGTVRTKDAIFALSAGRSGNVTNSYIYGAGGVPTNISPYVLPFDTTLIAMSASTSVSKTWTAELRVGGSLVTGASLGIVSSKSSYDDSYAVDFSAGDGIQFYASGTLIPQPLVSAFFRRR